MQNPYGLTASFQYDSSNRLSQITDAIGQSSTIQYDSSGYITNLVTPYGTNSFGHTVNVIDGQGNFGGHTNINRAIKATRPDGSKELYQYRFDSTTFMPSTYSNIPTSTHWAQLMTGTEAPMSSRRFPSATASIGAADNTQRFQPRT